MHLLMACFMIKSVKTLPRANDLSQKKQLQTKISPKIEAMFDRNIQLR